MSRSGYSEDYDDEAQLMLYRCNVDRASCGKRGQKFFRDLVAALDTMPVKELAAHVLVEDGQMCAMGAVAKHRKVSLAEVDPGDNTRVGQLLDIAKCLAAETAYMNDEANYGDETPAARWVRMRKWAHGEIKATKPGGVK